MNSKFENILNKSIKEASDKEIYLSLLEYCKLEMANKPKITSEKKVYYISAEFLIGKLLSNNLINLGIYEDVKNYLLKANKDITTIEEYELEPSLGNGGLGRLAACFLDSAATLGLNVDGIGLNYHLGLFKQKFVDNLQIETANPWIDEKSWLVKKANTYKVQFKDFSLNSILYDIDIVGYENGVNSLHLFDIDSIDESIVNTGIDFDESDIFKNLTLFLYPDDSTKQGELLRIYQQYFMVSNGAQLILEDVKNRGINLEDLSKYVTIQINDTHPTMVIPELIRLLMNENISFEKAVEIVSNTCAYTNHTILAEALEKWPLDYLEDVCPIIVPIIKQLDELIKNKYNDPQLNIIDQDNRVHMAHIDIHFSYSVNGVAYLHTEILKQSELKVFNELYPHKFNNKTNGITFRRWLLYSNQQLTKYLDELIGEDYKKDSTKLNELLNYIDDPKVLKNLSEIKRQKKIDFKNYLYEKQNILIDENSIYDIQIKRLHEYKRQQMNALYIIYKYMQIKQGIIPAHPITFIFGAKAAPAYTIAKDIIHLILCLQTVINNDPIANKYIKVVMVENYNVSWAEKIIPSCDISEQISLASKEASGTGNMKFMLNGGITLGTMDGANVEISELVGEDNIYIFGKDSETVIDLYAKGAYCSRDFYNEDNIKLLVDYIISDDLLEIGNRVCLERLHNELINKDWFMTLLDLNDYISVKDKLLNDYNDQDLWEKMSLVNIAKAGFFSSDRTMAEYNNDIWKIK